MKKVLVVDDEESILKVVGYALSEAGFEVHTAGDARGAEFMFEQGGPDLVILDVMLPGKSGLDIAKKLRLGSGLQRLRIHHGHGRRQVSKMALHHV